MLTEFNGEPVAGGTLPAMIWKAFIEKVPEDGSQSFNSPPYLGGASTWVVRRDGKWQLDNGYCRASRLVAYFSGERPDSEADCKPNEVSRAARARNDRGGRRGDARRAAAGVPRSSTGRRRPGPFPASSSTRTRGAVGSPRTTRSRSWSRKRGSGCSRTSSARASPTPSTRRPSQDQASCEDSAGHRPPRSSGSRRRPASRSRPGCASGSWSGTAHGRRAGERVAPGLLGRARDPDARRGDDVDRPPGLARARTAARPRASAVVLAP